MEKVSIILPTYNVGEFLKQCLKSITRQTYKNIEVIIIIDGATDDSYDIAKDFAAKDKRFFVFLQENAGSGSARNNGIEHATGDFIIFVDPDDWIDEDYVEKLLSFQHKGNYDIVACGENTVLFSKDGKIKHQYSQKIDSFHIIGKEQLYENHSKLFCLGVINPPHCKLYKACIIRNSGVRFPNLRRSQDIVFNYQLYNHINSIYVADYTGYNYRIVNKQRTLRLKNDYYKTIGLIYNDLKALYCEWGIPFKSTDYASSLYGSVYALLESFLFRHENIKVVLEDSTIKEIIKNAHPYKMHLRLVRYLTLSHHYLSTAYLIKIISFFKNIIH
jgi:glycosyltransferase involved in cell wall biosynthesis